MYSGLLHSHNGLRWLVLLAFLVAIILAFAGWFGKKDWTKGDKISGLLLVLFMDLQFVIGFVLYAFVSPITKMAFNDFGAAMKNDALRFYAIEHIVMMTFAVIVMHVGRARSKRDVAPWLKHRSAAIFYSISLLFVLLSIPWDRAMF